MVSSGNAGTTPPSGGPTVGEKYRLCSRLGGGGQAEVFLALACGPLGFSKLVVLKKLRPEMLEQPELVSMFLDEARLAARLNHPNIVHTYEVGAGDDYFIAMEYLEGQALSRLRADPRAASLGPSVWARVIADALGGLHHAHEMRDYDGTPLGIVHRDVSPQNLFITYDGLVKLVDFGVAKAALNAVRTEAGAIKGKASYMAPEQVLGRADRRSDVFSMGVVLWEALAARKLFSGEMVRVLHRVLHEPIPRVSSVVPGVDPRLDAIVARAVEKKADERYPTAQAMREALEAYLADTERPARPEDIGRWMQEAFADEREAARRRVQAATEGASYEPDALLPSLTGTLSPRSPVTSLPPPPPSADPYLLTPPSANGPASTSQFGVLVHQPLAEPLQRPNRFGRALVGLGALGVLGAGMAFALGPGSPLTATAPLSAAATVASGASLELRSEPTGAHVSWNGEPLGMTPLKLDLRPGAHTLLLAKDGYQTEALVMNLPAPGAFVSRTVSLRLSAPHAPGDPAAPIVATARAVRPSGVGRRPPAVAPPPPATAPPAPTPLAPRTKVQVVGDEVPKKFDVIE